MFKDFLYRDLLPIHLVNLYSDTHTIQENLYHDSKNYALLALCFLPGILLSEFLPDCLTLKNQSLIEWVEKKLDEINSLEEFK
jgi:hypothetical protein